MLLGDPGGDYVRVVSPGCRNEHVGILYPRLLQYLPVETDPLDRLAVKAGMEPHLELLRISVDDGDRETPLLESLGKFRTDATTTKDHRMHVGKDTTYR